MVYVRAHDTTANARGRVVKRYEVVYRAKARTDDGRTITRLRQEPTRPRQPPRRAAELNARKHRRAIDPLNSANSHDWVGKQQVSYLDGATSAALQCYSIVFTKVGQFLRASHGVSSLASNARQEENRALLIG
jgi:hypothetical protein